MASEELAAKLMRRNQLIEVAEAEAAEAESKKKQREKTSEEQQAVVHEQQQEEHRQTVASSNATHRKQQLHPQQQTSQSKHQTNRVEQQKTQKKPNRGQKPKLPPRPTTLQMEHQSTSPTQCVPQQHLPRDHLEPEQWQQTAHNNEHNQNGRDQPDSNRRNHYSSDFRYSTKQTSQHQQNKINDPHTQDNVLQQRSQHLSSQTQPQHNEPNSQSQQTSQQTRPVAEQQRGKEQEHGSGSGSAGQTQLEQLLLRQQQRHEKYELLQQQSQDGDGEERSESFGEDLYMPSMLIFNPYSEFKELSRKEIQHYQKVFNQYDINNDKFIDFEELKRMMEKLGAPQTHLALKAMIREVDEDQDNKISFREFLLIFRKARAGELSEESGLLEIYRQMNAIDVTKEGIKGAANFFEAKVAELTEASRFEQEIRAEQEEKVKLMEEKKQRRAAFKAASSIFQ